MSTQRDLVTLNIIVFTLVFTLIYLLVITIGLVYYNFCSLYERTKRKRRNEFRELVRSKIKNLTTPEDEKKNV